MTRASQLLKSWGALRTLIAKLYVTPDILLEYSNRALESRNRWLAKGGR
mgnify:CR=1 FL=1